MSDRAERLERIRLLAGQAVVWVLALIGILISLLLYSRLATRNLGPLNIPLYLGALGLGAAGAHVLWSAAGRRVRGTTRRLLGYWPLLLYLGAQVYRRTHHV